MLFRSTIGSENSEKNVKIYLFFKNVKNMITEVNCEDLFVCSFDTCFVLLKIIILQICNCEIKNSWEEY